jgi:pentatricopeptide repeat protein
LAWRDIAADPSRWLELLVKKFFRMVNDYEYTTSLNYNYVHAETPFFRFPWLSFGSVFALALVGMWLGRKRWQEWLPIFGLAGVYVISNVFILISAEYRYGLMPALFFFAGLAVNESITSLRLKRWQALTLPGLLLLVAFWVSFAPALPEEVKHYHLGMAYKKMGLALEDAGAYTKAARAFEASLKFFQDQDKYIPEAQFLLGRVYLRLGSADEAVRHLAAAHAQFPQDKNVNNVLVSALSRQGDYPRALKICREMAEQDPQNPGTWVSLGAALLWMGKDAQAQAAFGQALQLNPTLVNSIQNEREQIINNRSSGPKQP